MLRCFEDGNIIHVANKVDPIADAEVVETELMLADLESLEKRRDGVEEEGQAGGDKDAKVTARPDRPRAGSLLPDGKSARLVEALEDEEKAFPRAATADRQAGALCLQCRRGRRPPPATPMTKQVEEYAKQHKAPR